MVGTLSRATSSMTPGSGSPASPQSTPPAASCALELASQLVQGLVCVEGTGRVRRGDRDAVRLYGQDIALGVRHGLGPDIYGRFQRVRGITAAS